MPDCNHSQASLCAHRDVTGSCQAQALGRDPSTETSPSKRCTATAQMALMWQDVVHLLQVVQEGGEQGRRLESKLGPCAGGRQDGLLCSGQLSPAEGPVSPLCQMGEGRQELSGISAPRQPLHQAHFERWGGSEMLL